MLEPGDQVGRYEIQRRLGSGGMGTVYVAHDPVLGRLVGIKVFHSDLDIPDARERFAREARSAAALAHPNIVAVYDYGEFRGQPFIVMEYVPGETLADVIRQRTAVPLIDKLRWVEELCGGAGFAHQRSVVHRDIKPGNLMIDRSGRLRILDFGIARVLALASKTTGMLSGTPGYMAPEQILGDAVDQRADIFSIGAVFYELLSYREAFPGETLPAITHKILSGEPVPITQYLPDAAGRNLAPILDRALQKDPEQRFQDADSLRLAVARVRSQFESDVVWTSPTAPIRPTPLPAGPGSRSTPSQKRPLDQGGIAAALTPPPGRPRTDREAIARRRAAHIESAILAGQLLLERGELEAALENCQEALALDEEHVGALELEAAINAAIDARGQQLENGFEPTVVSPREARDEDDSGPVAGADQNGEPRGESAYEVAGLGPTEVVARRPALPTSEPTLIVPSRQTPAQRSSARARKTSTAPAAPEPLPAAPVTGKVVRETRPNKKAKSDKGTAPQPAPRQPAGPGIRQRLQVVADRCVATTSAALAQFNAVVRRKRSARTNGIIAGVVVVVAAAAAVGAYVITRPSPTVATGILVIDAVPWANIAALEREDGKPQALPSAATPAATPLSLTLPAGKYHVVLNGPGAERRRVDVEVLSGRLVTAPIARFQTMTPETYFEQYLSPTPAAAPPPDDPSAAATAAGASPAGAQP